MATFPMLKEVLKVTLEDLKERLGRARWPYELPGTWCAAGLLEGVDRLFNKGER